MVVDKQILKHFEFSGNFLGLLIRRLNHNISKNTPTIVFCNKSSTSSYLSYFLNENCILHEMVNGKMPQCVREGRYDKFQSGEVEVLIGTDILSRGLDTCRVIIL